LLIFFDIAVAEKLLKLNFFMMKNILFITLSLFLHTSLFAQHIKFNWQSCFYQSGYQKDVREVSQISTGDGFLILCAAETDIMMSPPGESFYSDIWLIKTDTIGNFLWDKYFGGTNEEDAVKIIHSGDGNYYIFGATGSSDGGATIPPYLPNGGLWFIKIDGNGNILWDKVAGSVYPSWGYGADCIATNDGGILSRVNTVGNDGDISIHYDGWDVWLLKLNAQGDIDWDFTLGTEGLEIGGTPIQTSDSGYLVPVQGVPGLYGNITCDTALQAIPIGRAILVKLDTERHIQWQQCLGASDHIGFTKVMEVNDGYIVGGYVSAGDGALEGAGYHLGYNHTGSTTSDIWLRKIDFEGNMQWQKCYGGSNDDAVDQLFTTSDGNLMVFGTTNSYNGDVTGLHYDPYYPTFALKDVWMFKVDCNNGNLLWNRCIGGLEREDIRSGGVVQKDDKNYTLSVKIIYGPTGDITCGNDPEFESFIWFSSITDTTAYLGEPEMKDLGKLINLYPNPATDYITLEIPHSFDIQHAQAEIIDVSGKILKSVVLTGQNPYLDTGDLPVGLYLLRLVTKQGFVSKRFIVNRN
jgi:hypothetical protein